jgi:hypothetical protein
VGIPQIPNKLPEIVGILGTLAHLWHGIGDLSFEPIKPREKMNKLMMTLAFATLMGSATMAQDNMKGDGSARAENLTEQMTTRLKLNDDQKTKVADINDRYAAEMKASMEERKANKAAGETVDREADRAKLKEVTAKKNAELKVVLTPEQMTEWQKMQGEMREKGKERMQERHDKNKTKSAE